MIPWKQSSLIGSNALMAFAAECFEICTFHRQRMKRAGLAPGDLAGPDRFSAVPLMTSLELSAAGPNAILADDLVRDIRDGLLPDRAPHARIVRVSQTSSSTGGEPKLALYTASDWEVYRNTLPALMSAFPPSDYARIFNGFAATHGAGRFIDDAFPLVGSIVLNRHHAAASPADVVSQLERGLASLGGATCLAAPPSSPPGTTKGAAIADLLDADFDNLIGRTIRMVLTAGNVSTGAFNLRARLDEVAAIAGRGPIPICEWYGSAEVGIAAVSCERGALHFAQQCVFGEVVRPETGDPVGEGERGVVVLTAPRKGSRYLRYVVGDEANVTYEPCACGRSTPRISAIARFEDHFRIKRGCSVTEAPE